ncbi:MAG: type I restriction-modification system subunit M N-terminal domain-containing protein [Pseudomonadota bacterium]|nr:type I restriction-modification system subunit M N-terminal domain-containing protein [Pseudomonadota bacterium]
MDASQIGKRAWSYAGVLQDAGLSCFEYVEQLTLLLFLKMADQLTEEPYNRAPLVPPELGWKALLPLDGAALEDRYRASLEKLGVKPGMLGSSRLAGCASSSTAAPPTAPTSTPS